MKQIIILSIVSLLSFALLSNADAQRRVTVGGERGVRSSANNSQAGAERTSPRTFNSSSAVRQMNMDNRSARMATRSNTGGSSISESSNPRITRNPSVSDRVISSNNNSTRANQPDVSRRENVLTTTRERNQLSFDSQRGGQVATNNSSSTGRVTPERNDVRNTPSTNNDYRSNNYRNNNSYRNNNNTYRNYTNNSYRNNNYSNSYRNNNYYYRSGYDRRIYIMHAPRYNYRPYNSISVYYGGNPYYYTDGLFYDYYGGYYQPIYPPFGIRISRLPFGYSRVYVGLNPFFYYNGIFYRNYNDSYEVVDAPMGATVSNLPGGAKSVTVNGEKFYELNGTYFQEDRNSKGKRIYVVVGKNGEINNTYEENDNSNLNIPQSNFQNGDAVSELPDGVKVVTLNGEKLYVSPDGVYFKEEVNGNSIQYKVVGR
ncbi:MAG: DUF6515 family protein [Ginsengibacter sp.]